MLVSREPLITNIIWRNLIFQVLYQVTVVLTLTFKGKDILNLKDDNIYAGNANTLRNTIILNAFVLCQIFNEFNARKPDQINIFQGLHKNHLFIRIIAITLVLQAMIVEFLKKFAKTTRLNPIQWIICIMIGFISWPLAVVKTIPVPEKPFSEYLPWRKTRYSECLSGRKIGGNILQHQFQGPMEKPEELFQSQEQQIQMVYTKVYRRQ